MSYVAAFYHIVFSTKSREMTINETNCEKLYKFCNYLVTEKGCALIRINGMGDHIHLLIELSPTLALSDFVKHIKQKSSIWMKESGLFPRFNGWGKEYFAHTVSHKDIPNVKAYIINQKAHHLAFPFDSELKRLVAHVGLTYFN